MGILLTRLAKKTPGEIMATPIKSVANTIKTEGPVLKQQINDTFVKSASQFKDLTVSTFDTKAAKSGLSRAANSFKNFIKSI